MTESPVVDCHLHVYWPDKYPYPSGPGVRPDEGEIHADPDALLRNLAANRVTHALLVQPSAHGSDNRAMIDTIAMSNGRMKGIAVVDITATKEELQELKAKGVVGIRLNLFSFANAIFESAGIDDFMARCADLRLFVEVFVTPQTWPKVIDKLRSCPAPIVIEHMGWPALDESVGQQAFQLLLGLAERRDCTVKLSCSLRMTRKGFPFDDVEPYALRLLEVFGPDRCMWGSDWPMFRSGHDRPESYAEELEAVRRWVPDAAHLRKVLWETPSRLFSFQHG